MPISAITRDTDAFLSGFQAALDYSVETRNALFDRENDRPVSGNHTLVDFNLE